MRLAKGFWLVSLALVVVLAPADAADNPPGMMQSTLLNGVKVRFDKGDLYLDKLQAVFLPEPTSNTTSSYKYNPDDGDSLEATVTSADGKVVLKLGFYAEKLKPPFWLLGSYKVLENHTGNEAQGSRVKLAPGKYALDFFVKGKKFYHFPFEVAELPSEDGFDPKPFYFLEGDWNDWGYLYYRDANPDMNLAWKVWLRIRSREKSKYVKPTMEVFRGDTRVAVGNENYSFSLRPEWQRVEFQFNTPPDAPEGTPRYMKAKHILAEDGDYRLVIKIDGELYGTWIFQVKEGKFAYTGRTKRGTADSLTFVEGGKDAWWYGRAE